MNIKEKLYKFYNEVLANNEIDKTDTRKQVDLFDIPDDMLRDDIEFIKDIKSIRLLEADTDFMKISGFSMGWSYTNANNEFIYGGLFINGYIEALVQDSDFWDVYNSLNRREPTETELAFLKKLNWFEKQAWGDDGKFGCFLREPGDFPPPIYFYDSGAYFPMDLSLEEYFDAMIASCAVRGWQYFYINFPTEFPDFKKVNRQKVYAELERTVQVLPKLFPKRDFTYHQNRFEEIKGKLKQK